MSKFFFGIFLCFLLITTGFFGMFDQIPNINAESFRNNVNSMNNEFFTSTGPNPIQNNGGLVTEVFDSYCSESDEEQDGLLNIFSTLKYSCMCDWVNGCQDHGPEKTVFNQCDKVYFYAEVEHVQEGDIFKAYWRRGNQDYYVSAWNPISWSGSGCLWASYHPEVPGYWTVDLVCNDAYIGSGPEFHVADVPIEMTYSCMCDLVDGWQDHGPEKTVFNQGDYVYFYAEVEYANQGDLFNIECICNDDIVFEMVWDEPIEWSGSGCLWASWTVIDCGDCYVKFYCDDDFLGNGPQFVVNDNPSENYAPNVPSTPEGIQIGVIDEVYSFSTSTKDIDEDDISYGWDWDGDGEVDEWSSPIPNKQINTMSHLWENTGTYNVKVRAKDIHDSVSSWSESLVVEITNQPVVETLKATHFDSISAILNGKILADGGEPCKVQFRYRKKGSSSWNYKPENMVGSYSKGETFSETVTGLTPDKKYEFCAGANNFAGTFWGDPKEFTTSPNEPPGRPNKPIGPSPSKGVPERNYSFTCNAPDAEGDKVYFQFNFVGNGEGKPVINITKPKFYGPYDSNKNVVVEGVQIPKDFSVDQFLLICVRAANIKTENNDYLSPFSKQIKMWLTNPPNNLNIDGPSNGKPRTDYTYTVSADEPDNEDVYYYIDWGDGTNTEWKGPYTSGEEKDFTHKWTERKPFTIRFKARDKNEIESDWVTKPFTVPKNKQYINTPFFNFLESYPMLFQLLQRFLRF